MTGLVYFVVFAELVIVGKPWLGVTFLGYAIGNLGLYMVATQ